MRHWPDTRTRLWLVEARCRKSARESFQLNPGDAHVALHKSLILVPFKAPKSCNSHRGFLQSQAAREGCGCFRGLFGGSRGKLRESPGKIAGKICPNRAMLQILGFRAPGKANLPETLGRHCLDLVPTYRAGCFLKSTVQPS